MGSAHTDGARRCCNCGTVRDDLIEHEGALWCPTIAECDFAMLRQWQLDDHFEHAERN